MRSERRLLDIERHKAIWRMQEEHLGDADVYRRLQSLSVKEDAAEVVVKGALMG
eukprot:CAMPEP_0194431548 /NCGR_PEP_ID=MMETSP0176-20130528/64202_1 /TAXON_ID=216777 /ORGANISM="Proboscia alata, Strain PI-D3" /LENGTH=53 /DNA_ID=CAMNT_0039246871 /DNA_START=128 /DNA_END=289 /DNA_ORIENTATION=-